MVPVRKGQWQTDQESGFTKYVMSSQQIVRTIIVFAVAAVTDDSKPIAAIEGKGDFYGFQWIWVQGVVPVGTWHLKRAITYGAHATEPQHAEAFFFFFYLQSDF